MVDTLVDYSADGAGKFVALFFPDDYPEKNPGVPASELMELIGSDIKIGHLWRGAKNTLEFFWGPELDKTKVNEALSSFQSKYPGLEIKFRSDTIITM
ncbi:MAG: hypothetical protein A2896_02360 [Candidatus Nealsonbacteria bacterium RIFCSPLOWO2_01_FULL_43_32]|uniref:Uncharacterized protein n=1 Tax=Candidatus Nealsonbacteria bacterium RIFCSPLOWO2_01_FULL_43_32 TaxID=1801672 RepID=A0A1G2EEB9_9BACT|nr:MAG: hypothetical protein A2896_02360 [Candidatus Nealsonbacteria bacterium RIFCSPLOWO2_01_FULL_43_32]